MAITPEPYVVEDGMTSVFSQIVNCTKRVRPSDEGYEHQIKILSKRPWLIWSESWVTWWNILWGAYYNSLLYLYDDWWDVYTFNWTVLTDLSAPVLDVDETDALPHVMKVAFLWWGRYPDASTEFTVASYSWSTITTNETTLTSAYIWKYVYVYSWAAAWLRQYASIQDIPANNKIKLDEAFDVAPTASDVLYIFNDIKSQIRFPQLKKSWDPNYVYARDSDWNENYIYLPNVRKVINFDSRIIYLHKNKTNILVSDSRSYEVIDLTKLVRLSQEALNIEKHLSYVIVFFETEMWLLKKNVYDTITWDFLYEYQDGLWKWIYSEEAYYSDGKNLYTFSNDNRLYGIDVTLSSDGKVVLNENMQAQTLNYFFDTITWGKVFFRYSLWVLRMFHVWDDGTTKVVKLENWEWLIDEYTWFWDNFWRICSSIWTQEYMCHEDNIYQVWWLTDAWTNIRQFIKMYWPASFLDRNFTLYRIRVVMWFDGNPLWWTISYTVWGNTKTTWSLDIEKLSIINEVNELVLNQWEMWASQMGSVEFWGESWLWVIEDYYSEYILVAKNVWKQWTYFTVEIENETDKDFILRYVLVDLEPHTPLSVSNKNIW